MQFSFIQHSTRGSSISENHTYHGSVHLIPVTTDGSAPGCPSQPLVCPEGKAMQPRLFQRSDESVTAQARRQRSRSKPRSTRLWSGSGTYGKSLPQGLVCSPLCTPVHPPGGRRPEGTVLTCYPGRAFTGTPVRVGYVHKGSWRKSRQAWHAQLHVGCSRQRIIYANNYPENKGILHLKL